MNRNIILTCAVTGGADSTSKSPHVPVTPEQIATSAIDAAKAGAAIVHLHVRDPKTGQGSRDLGLYREVVDRIRSSETDVVINLTTGMGGDLFLGSDDNPMDFQAGTDCVGQLERMEHVTELLPEICSLDCGSFNFGNSNYVYVSTPDMLRIGMQKMKELGVKPELEVFDLGHMWFAKTMCEQGFLDDAPLFQICMDIPWGLQASPRNFQTMVDNLPAGANWGGFATGAMQMPIVAQSALLGGNVRVGLEDNLYLDRGVLATNAQLVERGVNLLENMGAKIQTPQQARETLGLHDFKSLSSKKAV